MSPCVSAPPGQAQSLCGKSRGCVAWRNRNRLNPNLEKAGGSTMDHDGKHRGQKIRVAIIGVGNCASSLVQGVEFYRNGDEDGIVHGLMNIDLGGYPIHAVEFSAAFDVVEGKVGLDLAEAIFAPPNNTIKFAEVPNLKVRVDRGMTHDGLGTYVSTRVRKARGSTADIVKILKDTGTDVVVNYLPVGSEMATKWYVEQVLEAGCAFVNCIPVFIASQPYWAQRFADRRLPIIGDDVKSQVGATILHRVLTNLYRERGVKLERTYQLNFGGNMDFYNMLERERLESKKISKTAAEVPEPRFRRHAARPGYPRIISSPAREGRGEDRKAPASLALRARRRKRSPLG